MDTAAKRFAAQNLSSPWRRSVPIPDGTIGGGDRQSIPYHYSGISWGEPVVVVVTTPTIVGGGKSRRRRAYLVTFKDKDYLFESQEAAQEFLDQARVVLPAQRGRPRKPKPVVLPKEVPQEAQEAQAAPLVRLPDNTIVSTRRDESAAWRALEQMRDEEEINLLMAVL